MRSPSIPFTRNFAVLVTVAMVLALAGPVGRPADAATPYVVYKAEAELFDLPPGGSILSSSSASWGAGIVLREPGMASLRATVPTGAHVVVRARAARCGDVPRMSVRFGDDEVLTADVRSAMWTEYVSEDGIDGGTYDIAVGYVGRTDPAACEPRLSIDGVWVVSAVPINQAEPGGACEATDGNLRPHPDVDGYDSSVLGDAPGYYEVGMPTSEPAPEENRRATGVMMVIHGGGWFISGPGVVTAMRDRTDRWRDAGWTTVSITSDRACGSWMDDITWFYDAIDDVFDEEICAHGASAGGQLAAMLATHRDVACVIGEGAPTDLEALDRQHAYDPASPEGQTAGPSHVQAWAGAAFGQEALAAESPLRAVDDLDVPTLLAVAERDGAIPVEQVVDMTAALDAAHPGIEHLAQVLDHGPLSWTHASVSRDSLDVFWSQATRLASTAVAP